MDKLDDVKILYLLDTSRMGGVQKYVFYLLDNLDSKFKSYLICPSDGEFFPIFKKLNIKLIRLKVNFVSVPKILNLVRKENIKIIHANLGMSKLLSVIIKFFHPSIRIVFTEHFVEPSHLSKTNLKGFLSRIVHNRLVSFIDFFIAVSDSVKEILLNVEKIPLNKVVRIYNGVPYNKIQTPTMNRTWITDSIQGKSQSQNDVCNGKTKKLVAAGRFSKEKGFLYAIRAIKIVSEKKPEIKVKFIIAGSGKEEKNLKNLVKYLGITDKIIFSGFFDDIFSLLSKADIFIQPSLSEGFGIGILEAMSIGLPVIASNCGGIKEIIQDGVNGILVPPQDANAIANAVVELLSNRDKAALISFKARETIKNNYTVSRMVNETERIYDKLL